MKQMFLLVFALAPAVFSLYIPQRQQDDQFSTMAATMEPLIAGGTTPGIDMNSCPATTTAASSRSLVSPAAFGYGSTSYPCTFSQTPIERCQTWNVGTLVMLQNSSKTQQWTSQIKSFLEDITVNCGADSEFMVLVGGIPDATSPKVIPINAGKDNALAEILQPENVIVKDLYKSVDILLHHLQTLNLSTPEYFGGRTALIYTDIPCHYFCGVNMTQAWQVFASLTNDRYLVRFVYMSDVNISLNCFDELFNGCQGLACSVGIVGKDPGSLHSCVADMMTCSMPPSKKEGLSGTTLTIVVTIPTICLTAILIIGAVICYKKFKIRAMVMARFFAKHEEDGEGSLHKHGNEYVDPHSLAAPKCIVDDWEITRKHLRVYENKLLGNGAFAKVFKGSLMGDVPLLKVDPKINLILDNRETELEVAVKKMPAHADDQNRLDFMQEIDFMKGLGYHAHIISMLGCLSCPIEPMIVVEFCYHGDMLKFLRSHKTHILMSDSDDCPIDVDMCLRIKDLVSLAWQVSDGMTYLHSKGFVHRDLAARNILLTQGLVAKIGDFGLCRYVDSALYTSKGGRLPIKWMAPESLKRYEFSPKSDVWSFSILLFEVFSLGDGPFPLIQPLDMIDYLESGYRMNQPEKCPNEIFSLMELCWAAEPARRPNFEEVRSRLTIMLNMDDANYGYLDLKNPNSRNLKDMMKREVGDTGWTFAPGVSFDKPALSPVQTPPAPPEEELQSKAANYDSAIEFSNNYATDRPTLSEENLTSSNASPPMSPMASLSFSEVRYTCDVFHELEDGTTARCSSQRYVGGLNQLATTSEEMSLFVCVLLPVHWLLVLFFVIFQCGGKKATPTKGDKTSATANKAAPQTAVPKMACHHTPADHPAEDDGAKTAERADVSSHSNLIKAFTAASPNTVPKEPEKDKEPEKKKEDDKEKKEKEEKEKIEKEAKEKKEKEVKEGKPTKDTKEVKEVKDVKENKEVKDTKEKEKKDKDVKEVKETKEKEKVKEAKEIKDSKYTKDSKDVKETKEKEKVKEVKDVKDVKEVKETKDTKEAKEVSGEGKETEKTEKMDRASSKKIKSHKGGATDKTASKKNENKAGKDASGKNITLSVKNAAKGVTANPTTVLWTHEIGQNFFKIINKSGGRIAFSLRSSDAIYSVNPTTGYVDDTDMQIITVMRTKGTFKLNHYISIQHAPAAADVDFNDFAKLKPNIIQVKMIKK